MSSKPNILARFLGPLIFALLLTIFAQAAPQSDKQPSAASDSRTIAEVDAGLGPCTADFVVNDEAGKPVYAAKIHVRVTSGFMSLHKLDLSVGTNAEGKARFIGLPENSKQGGLFFHAHDGDGPTYREASAFDNPSKTCKAQFTVVLRNKPQQDD